jgi:hypothetical protein
MLLASAAYQLGDTVPAWPAAAEALRLAPRSLSVVDGGFMVALALRHYGDAGELVARWRALKPTGVGADLAAARLAAAVGDSGAVARALRAYQAKGGRFRADDRPFVGLRTPLQLMRDGDRALGDALLAATPTAVGARTGEDTLLLYGEQARLLMRRGDAARARPLLARGFAIARRLSGGGRRTSWRDSLRPRRGSRRPRATGRPPTARSPPTRPRTPRDCGTHRVGTKTRY